MRGRAPTPSRVLLCIVALLAACGGAPGDEAPVGKPTAPSGTQASDDDTDPPGDGDPVAGGSTEDAPGNAPDDRVEPDGQPPPDDGVTSDVDAVLVDAVARYAELRTGNPDALGGYCALMGDWEQLRRTAVDAGVEDGDQVASAGFATSNGRLTEFGCSIAPDGQISDVLMTVVLAQLDLPDDLATATTPDGREVLVGPTELGNLWLFTQEPVSTAVLVGRDAVLHVTALPDALSSEQLLPLVDAAVRDLAQQR